MTTWEQTAASSGRPFRLTSTPSPSSASALPTSAAPYGGKHPRFSFLCRCWSSSSPGKGTRLQDRKVRWLNIVARLRDGFTPASAQAQLAPLWHALRADELSALGKRSQRFTDDFLTNSRLLVLPGARGLSYSRDNLRKPLARRHGHGGTRPAHRFGQRRESPARPVRWTRARVLRPLCHGCHGPARPLATS